MSYNQLKLNANEPSDESKNHDTEHNCHAIPTNLNDTTDAIPATNHLDTKCHSNAEVPSSKHIEMVAYTPDDKDTISVAIDNDNDGSNDNIDENGCCVKWVETVDSRIKGFFVQIKAPLQKTIKIICAVAYLAYFGYCMNYSFGDEHSVVLLVITVFAAMKLMWPVISRRLSMVLPKTQDASLSKVTKLRKIARYFLYFAATLGFAIFFALEIFPKNPGNLQSVIGMGFYILICFLLSKYPSRIQWHPVFWGFAIQIVFAMLTLRTDTGFKTFEWLGDKVQGLLKFSEVGSEFMFGKNYKHLGLAFEIAGIIIFFNSIINVLNHLGVIEFVVLKMGMFLHHCLDTGPVESVIAAANIFIGLSEAPLLVRPYLPTVTQSELHSIMVCGFASIAGGIMAMFIEVGAPANHLLTAAVISAPSALAITKMLYPETERINVGGQKSIRMRDATAHSSALQACAEGACQAAPLLVSITTNLLAFVSIISLMDAILAWLGQRAGFDGLSFEFLCSYGMYIVSLTMGVPLADCGKVGALIGIKLFATPVIGYITLGELIANRQTFEDYTASNGTWYYSGNDIVLEATNTTLVRGIMSERAEVISTYAMCGFSAFSAIGITIGAYSTLCPKRYNDVIKLVVSSFIGGNIASFVTGAVAGIMYTGQ